MDHNRNFEDQELMRLLADLKAATPEYPRARLAKRRAAFLAGISAVAVGGVVATKIAAEKVASTALKTAMSQVDKVVLAAELLAVTGLTAYVGVTAYVHREELKNLFFPPSVSTSVSTEVPSTQGIIPTETPGVTGTVTLMPTGTLGPGVPTAQPTEPGPQPSQAPPTAQPPTNPPPPPTEPPPTRPGLHLGQTKTPEP